VNNPTYLDQYRQLLLSKQRELLAASGGRLVLGAAGRLAGGDLMDQAFAESEVTVDASLSELRSSLRRDIEWALVRLKKGNYGICAACGKAISLARLKAIPWTDYCRDCMEQENE
jgi:RNA polymerase-binding protein DksA